MIRDRFELRVVGPAVAAALALLALLAAERGGSLGTSYASISSLAHAADVLAGFALLGAGALAWQQRPGSGLASAAILAGAAWSAQDWIGWDGMPALRTTGGLIAPLFVPLVLQLVVGRRPTQPMRWLLGTLYTLAALTALGLALFRDPFADPSCWSNCTDDVLLLRNEPDLARVLSAAGASIAAVGGGAIAAVALVRLRERARSRAGLLLCAAVAVGVAELGYGLERAIATEDPERSVFVATFLMRTTAVVGLALGIGSVVLGSRRSRLALARLGRELAADSPGGLRALLARSLGDPTLQVGYWVRGRTGYVDLDGHPVTAPAPASGRASTAVVRGGRPVALIVHDRRLLDELRLEEQIGAAASLAADNERLQAEVSARLEDLRLSRARTVAAADDRRRRLERDLHDSAQQRLLAVSYDVRLAKTAARAAGDEELDAALGKAANDAAGVLAALRELARGIFPAILDEAGLGPALVTLAELAPLPTKICAAPDARLPPPVELAMYLVVQTAIQAVSAAGASYARVRVVQDGGVVRTEVSSDAAAGIDVPVPLEDRLGALGGRALAASHGIRADAPCA